MILIFPPMSVSFLTGIRLRSFLPTSICEFTPRTPRKARSKQFKGCHLSLISQRTPSYCANQSVFGGDSNVTGECDDCVEVIMVGSRRDSLMDFCSASPFRSPGLRFWCIISDDSGEVRLQEWPTNKGNSPSMENILTWQPSCKAVILVVSAAYGQDHDAFLEVVSNVKSRNWLVVGLILKPFSFEGKRRQEEVNALSSKIQNLASFCIVLDTDALLENDLVTLDEAWRKSNNAALMVMNAISILFSEKHKKFLNTKANITRDLQISELQKILKGHSEARIAFGDGYNIESSLLQAIDGFTFPGMNNEHPDGLIFCTIETSSFEDTVDIHNILQTVRSTIKCKGKVILSIVIEPNMEPNSLQATIIFFGFSKDCLAPRNGMLFSLGQYFPFIFNIFKNRDNQNSNSEKASAEDHHTPCISNVGDSSASNYVPTNSLDATADDTNSLFPSIFPLVESRDEVDCEERDREMMESCSNYATFELDSEGYPMLKEERLARSTIWNGYTTELSKVSSIFSEVSAFDGTVSIYQQPVGVKISKSTEEASMASKAKNEALWGFQDNAKRQYSGPSVSSSESPCYPRKDVASTNRDIYDNGSKKQGGLSVRAASMLESERDAYKKWSRVMEMQYRGATYIGHIQGGLPEGKGRLLLPNGSIYDGMWHYGKRCGMGTLYFNNGDVFKGQWRDDVMHGKGWIYFENGDRWFVNFWKGKPNGEGRFYSHFGDIFFGNFKDGWRHGDFLRIDVDGSRHQEVWDEGVLVTQRELDAS